MFENKKKKHRVSLDFGRWFHLFHHLQPLDQRPLCLAGRPRTEHLQSRAHSGGRVATGRGTEHGQRGTLQEASEVRGGVTGNESVLVGHRCGHDPSEPPQCGKIKENLCVWSWSIQKKHVLRDHFWARQMRWCPTIFSLIITFPLRERNCKCCRRSRDELLIFCEIKHWSLRASYDTHNKLVSLGQKIQKPAVIH